MITPGYQFHAWFDYCSLQKVFVGRRVDDRCHWPFLTIATVYVVPVRFDSKGGASRGALMQLKPRIWGELIPFRRIMQRGNNCLAIGSRDSLIVEITRDDDLQGVQSKTVNLHLHISFYGAKKIWRNLFNAKFEISKMGIEISIENGRYIIAISFGLIEAFFWDNTSGHSKPKLWI